MNFLSSLLQKILGGGEMQPATPAMPIQAKESLTEDFQPASGMVPMQPRMMNPAPAAMSPMGMPKELEISMPTSRISPVDLSGAIGGMQPQPFNIAQVLQPASYGRSMQPTPFARDMQPTMRSSRFQGALAPEFLQKAIQVDQSGD